MIVVVRSRSLWFTVLSIILNVPIARAKRRQMEVVPKKPVVRVDSGQMQVARAQESKYWNRVAL
jgi:hypothetical protein